MTKYEFEALAGYEVSTEDFNNIIRPMYMATNLSEQDFIQTINRERFEVIRSTESLEREDRRLKEIQMYKAELKMYAEAREIGKRAFGL